MQGVDILALVDADKEKCTPHYYLFGVSNFRVLLTSPPRTKHDRRWLTQDVDDEEAVFVMDLWSGEEVTVASILFYLLNTIIVSSKHRCPLKRLLAAIRICGYNPRRCHKAAVSSTTLSEPAIYECKNLGEVISRAHAGQPIHRAFEIYSSLQGNWTSVSCGQFQIGRFRI